ncbi:class II aldolase/adducin N-terminal [Aspergillus insuetus]
MSEDTLEKTVIQKLSRGVTLSGVPSFTSVELRRCWMPEHLAGAFRVFARKGFVEGLTGHISLRDPEHKNCFWTDPYGIHFGLITVSDLILLDEHGSPRLHMINLDVLSFFGDAHGVYDDFGGVTLTEEESDRLAAALGPRGKALILRNHGLLTVGETVDEAAYLFCLMEKACRIQLMVDAAGAGSPAQRPFCVDGEAAKITFDNMSDKEALYCAFQPEYEMEKALSEGEFLK